MKKLILFIFVAFWCIEIQAQYRWEYGISLGGSNYLGDFGGKEETRKDFVYDMKLNQTRWVVGGFGRYKLNQSFALHGGLMWGRISGADGLSLNPARVGRNLSFRNDLIELAIRPEFTLYYDNDVAGKGYYNPDFRLYVFVGAAAFFNNPQAKNNAGEWVNLQPLKTEAVQYSKIQFAIPAGLGLSMTHLKKYRFGFEMGWRTTFTDYIDDASSTYPDLIELESDLAAEMSFRATEESVTRAIELGQAYGTKDGQSTPSQYIQNFQSGEKRADATHNDGYLFTQLSFSKVIKGKSNYYRTKYSWIKKKKRAFKKTRAKF
jgi:Domain of unknown function (DUF6089)